MTEDLRKAAISAILNIFETMFFTFLEPQQGQGVLEDPEPEPEKESDPMAESRDFAFINSEIHFAGVYSGFLSLFIPYDFSRVLTMNFMGFEEGVTESQIEDMAGELTNMVCGNLFSSLDKTNVYTLSPPSTKIISHQNRMPKVDPEDFKLNFSTEGHPVTLTIHFEKTK
jgi:hypothetical protein